MREMKESGIEWIGKIPKNKKIIRNKYMFKYEKGKLPSNTNTEKIGVPYIGASDLDSNTDEYAIYTEDETLPDAKKDDLLVLWDGARAGLAGTKKCGKISSTIVKISADDTVYTSFLYWYYKGFEKYMSDSVTGTTIPHMNRKYIEDIQFIDWGIDEQKKMTEYLDDKCSKIDFIIEKQQEIIEKLKEYKLSVITEAVTKGLNPNVEMKDSGCKWIGHIPKHWEMIYPKKLFSQRKDKAYEEDEQLTSSQKYGIISQKDFMELEGRQVMQVIKGEGILKHVEQGDFVISMRSFQGGLEYSEISGKISSAYVMVVPNNGLVYDRYYKWLFKSSHYITALQGTTNLIRDGQALRFSNFIQVYLPVFGKDEQKKIADYLDEICPTIETEIEKREKLLDKINEYKKSLIYEVVTGKKEV